MIPINTMTIIANTIAPRRPNMNQPATNAITENSVMWVHSTFMCVMLSFYDLFNVTDPPLEFVNIS